MHPYLTFYLPTSFEFQQPWSVSVDSDTTHIARDQSNDRRLSVRIDTAVWRYVQCRISARLNRHMAQFGISPQQFAPAGQTLVGRTFGEVIAFLGWALKSAPDQEIDILVDSWDSIPFDQLLKFCTRTLPRGPALSSALLRSVMVDRGTTWTDPAVVKIGQDLIDPLQALCEQRLPVSHLNWFVGGPGEHFTISQRGAPAFVALLPVEDTSSQDIYAIALSTVPFSMADIGILSPPTTFIDLVVRALCDAAIAADRSIISAHQVLSVHSCASEWRKNPPTAAPPGVTPGPAQPLRARLWHC